MRGAMKIASRFCTSKEDDRDDERMRPIPPLRRGNEDSRNPAQDDADIGDHGQDDDKQPDERGKIQSDSRKARCR